MLEIVLSSTRYVVISIWVLIDEQTHEKKDYCLVKFVDEHTFTLLTYMMVPI